MTEHICAFLPPGMFANENFTSQQVEDLKKQGTHSLFLISPNVGDKHVKLGNWCKEAEIDLILGFTDDPNNPNLERLEKALSITRKLAVANTRLHEWVGGANIALEYINMANKFDFEWVCTITHKTVMHDLRDKGKLRRVLGKTLCLCLCGYIIAGHLFEESEMPHIEITSLAGRDLNSEFGATVKNLTEYLTPMNILSGAGFQRGLDIGSRVYAKKLGFSGMVIGMPFNLEGTDKISVKTRDVDLPENLRWRIPKRICRFTETQALEAITRESC